jgi:hypothetical protein
LSLFGKEEIDCCVESTLKAEGTTWMQKTRIGLHAKIAKEVWEEADEETKEAVHTKRAGIIADKQKQSSAATRGAEEFHKLVLVSSTFQLSTSSTTHHGHGSPVQ